MSRVTAVTGGSTLSKKVKTPSRHSKVSKMTSETWTLRKEASSSSVSELRLEQGLADAAHRAGAA